MKVKTIYGWTPLLYASKNGYINIVKLLVNLGTDIETKSVSGWAPLHHASWNRHIDIVKLFIAFALI